MSTKKERETILDSIEDEYRHDLSIHLYSTFLYHQINPLFPRRNWSSWPLSIDQVPDPRSSKKFVDNDVQNIPMDDIDDKHTSRSEEANPSINGVSNGSEDITDQEDDNENDIEEAEEDSIGHSKEDQYMRIRSIATQETLSNSKIDIMIELQALLESKIHSKLKKANEKRKLRMSSDISSKLTNEICKKIANKVDHVVDNIINLQNQGQVRMASSRPYTRLLNWQDILLAGLDLDESRDRSMDTNSYSDLYKKCEKLFVNVKYDYEYEDEQDQDESDTDTGSESEEAGTDTQKVSNTNTGTTRHKFNYMTYLSHIENTHSGILNYRNFKERMLKSRGQETKLKDLKKNIFMRKLHLQNKYNDVSWERNKHSGNKTRRIQRKYRIQNEDKESEKRDALIHGGLQLTSDDFTVNI